jgi:rubrerythrin
MNKQRLLDHLNELLMIERFAAESYPQYAQQARDPEIKAMLRQFGVDSEKHRDIVTDLITYYKGRPSGFREFAAFTAAWTKGFADVIRRGSSEQVGNLRDLLLAEYWDRLDWQMLKQVADSASETMLTDAVNVVLADEEKHVTSLEEKVRQLTYDHITGADLPATVVIPVSGTRESTREATTEEYEAPAVGVTEPMDMEEANVAAPPPPPAPKRKRAEQAD